MPKSKARKRRVQPRPPARTRTAAGPGYQRWRGDAICYEFDAWLTRTWTVRGLTIALLLAVCAVTAFAIALHVVQHEQESSLWDGAATGDSVTAIVWNGAVMRIVDGGEEGDTDNAPTVGITRLAALLSSAGVCSLAFAMLLMRVFQARHADAYGWSTMLVPFNPVALSAAILFPIGAVVGSQFESITVSLLCGAGLASFAAIYVLVNWLRSR